MCVAPPAKTVLVVEDVPELRRLLGRWLRARYRVVEAGDADEALAALEAGPVDAVVLDLHLPPCPDSPREGLRIHRHLRERFPALPVAVVTANEDAATRREVCVRGIDGFLSKPLDVVALDALLVRMTESTDADRENLTDP